MDVGGQFEDTLSYACPSGVSALVCGDGVALPGPELALAGCQEPPRGALRAMSGSVGG